MKDQVQFDRLASWTRKNEQTGCWEWTGYVHTKRKYAGNRYGGTSLPAPGTKRGQRSLHAHRAMWIVVNGEPGPGQCVCHKCDNPLCINPDHLFLGTHKQNMADSKKKGRHFLSTKKLCKRGHPLEGENLYIDPCQFLRHCVICQRAKTRMKLGWPEHFAYALPPLPKGYTIDYETGEPYAVKSRQPRHQTVT